MKHMIIQTQKTVYKVNVDDIYYIQTHPTKAIPYRLLQKKLVLICFKI
ncbi:regulatory protein%2C single domain response regulator [Streptococcus pneumoniae]|nr:regulatory protein%2C single domain response regulator [Streptococcus pneumoniae]